MKALITGASSGIGRDMARELAKRGIDLILVARRTDRLEELKKELACHVEIIRCDLGTAENCRDLYEKVTTEGGGIDILINNAGFGLFGAFDQTELDTELAMIDLNIRALHILTKLFLRDFKARNSGYILNVASSAAFLPGPLMAAYYATKNYVLRLTEAIWEELRREGSGVSVSVLCPGPVQTEFNQTAGGKFAIQGLTSGFVAEYAIRKMFARKMVILPGTLMKLFRFGEHFVSEKFLLRCAYRIQNGK